MKREIAIVKSTANKSSCNCFGNRIRHTLSNTTKVTNVKDAATTCLGNMLKKKLSKVIPKFRAEAAGVKFWQQTFSCAASAKTTFCCLCDSWFTG